MTSPLEQILALKTEAKNQRDRGLKGYPRALARLGAAIKLAEEGLAETEVADARRQLHKELADCHGMVGGVQRRWGSEGPQVERTAHLAASCIAYDQGYGHEWHKDHGTPATYNLVNRLTGRLLIRPDLLKLDEVTDLGNGIEPMNVKAMLAKAVADIGQFLAHRDNFWTEADLALLKVLAGATDPSNAYAPFLALSPPGYAFGSALDALRPLAEATAAPALVQAIDLLTTRRPAA